jgi:polynucleotide 5'-kinase involved in rRNA processing
VAPRTLIVPRDSIVVGPGWDALSRALGDGVLMVVGAGGSGKTQLARWLVGHAATRAALVSADIGQPSVGVPGCLGLALRRPWTAPVAMWFVGDVAFGGHLLPVVVGTARLVARAQRAGASRVVVDTSGLVAGTLGRLLKWHEALAIGARHVVAVQQADELEALLAPLGRLATVHRVPPVDVARERSREERRAWREARFREHLRGADVHRFGRGRVLGTDWSAGLPPGRDVAARTLVGLLDREGFCSRVGVVDAVRAHTIDVAARCDDPGAVAWVQLGTLRVDERGSESRQR